MLMDHRGRNHKKLVTSVEKFFLLLDQLLLDAVELHEKLSAVAHPVDVHVLEVCIVPKKKREREKKRTSALWREIRRVRDAAAAALTFDGQVGERGELDLVEGEVRDVVLHFALPQDLWKREREKEPAWGRGVR